MRQTLGIASLFSKQLIVATAAVFGVASLVSPLLLAQQQIQGQGSQCLARQLSQFHAAASAAGLTQSSMPDAESAVLGLLAMRESAEQRGLYLPELSEEDARDAARYLHLRSGVLLMRAASLP
jgi:hypothetical protein